MKARHRIALLCVLVALVIFYSGERLQPRWLWSGAYWMFLVVGLLALIRRKRGRRPLK